MSFDQEPEIRYLLYHPESDVVFESYDGALIRSCIGSGECDDVTDLPQFEERFKREQDEKKQKR